MKKRIHPRTQSELSYPNRRTFFKTLGALAVGQALFPVTLMADEPMPIPGGMAAPEPERLALPMKGYAEVEVAQGTILFSIYFKATQNHLDVHFDQEAALAAIKAAAPFKAYTCEELLKDEPPELAKQVLTLIKESITGTREVNGVLESYPLSLYDPRLEFWTRITDCK